MLVLTRRAHESLIIGDQEITVRILEIRGGRVRLGIEAPPHVMIRRGELEIEIDEIQLVGAAD